MAKGMSGAGASCSGGGGPIYSAVSSNLTSNYGSGLCLKYCCRCIITFFIMTTCALFVLGLYLTYFVIQEHIAPAQADTTKYRVCIVDGRGGFKRSGKFCPTLDRSDSKVECVIGLDRLDCLRRISKGTVDFTTLYAEDLVAAHNSDVEVLITNEMRFIASQPYAYDVVAIVNDDAGINDKHDLKDKRLCHPGYGYEEDWTRILANFFEASVVPKSCEPHLTLIENRIRASSKYFRAACKAGPWVSDSLLDEKLKTKYKNLCALCGSPGRCSKNDKYWGRRGPLYCLTDGAGDVSWSRLDDARVHFGLVQGGAAATPDGFSFLCPDGTKRPLNATNPCVWVSKPWPLIVSKRTSSQEIQGFVNRLEHTSKKPWENALLNLLESYHADISNVNPIQDIESYFLNVPGFLSANSFTGCHPPRSVRICTVSNIENAKCGWMREAAAVYGVEPDIDCIKADNKTHCMDAVQKELADVVFVSPDMLMQAEKDHNLKTLLYEDVKPEERYETVAVVRKNAGIKKFSDLKGRKACFPHFEGVAWNSMLYTFHRFGLLSYDCPYSVKAAKFFGDMCAPGAPKKGVPESITKLCKGNYEGDLGALKCLALENADVAFVSKNNLKKILNGPQSHEKWVTKLKKDDTHIICDDEFRPCELSWATVSQAMVRGSYSEMATHESYDVLMKVDELFGNYYKSLTRSFSLYGPFNGVHDVLLHDNTDRLQGKIYMDKIERDIPDYDTILNDVKTCVVSSSNVFLPTSIILLALMHFLV